jgi:hypothetical protein
MNTIIGLSERQSLVENYVERLLSNLSPDQIREMLTDYIYSDKFRMTNVALFAEINEFYPDLLED